MITNKELELLRSYASNSVTNDVILKLANEYKQNKDPYSPDDKKIILKLLDEIKTLNRLVDYCYDNHDKNWLDYSK